MTTDNDMEMLDTLFAAERSCTVTPSQSLMTAVMADATLTQAQVAQTAPIPAPRASLWSRITDGLGGWQMVSGLAACAVLGLALGYSQPFGDGVGVGIATLDDTDLAFGLGDLFDDTFLLELDT